MHLQNMDFELTCAEMVQIFQSKLQVMVTEFFPEKQISISSEDKPYFNESLRALKRKRQREYTKHGKSEKYLKLKALFDEKKSCEIEKYKEKILLEVTEGRRGSIYPALKRLGLRPGSEDQSSFDLSRHLEQGLTTFQSVEIIATHFSIISQEFSPLSLAELPPKLRDFLQNDNALLPPKLNSLDVYKRLVKAKKPRSQIPGDLPPKLVKAFPQLLSEPVTIIFNKITSSATYPHQWKLEHQIPIPKTEMPESEDQLRNTRLGCFNVTAILS